jgi:hypothetical protein
LHSPIQRFKYNAPVASHSTTQQYMQSSSFKHSAHQAHFHKTKRKTPAADARVTTRLCASASKEKKMQDTQPFWLPQAVTSLLPAPIQRLLAPLAGALFGGGGTAAPAASGGAAAAAALEPPWAAWPDYETVW